MINQPCPECDFIYLGDDRQEEVCPSCGAEWEHDVKRDSVDDASDGVAAEGERPLIVLPTGFDRPAGNEAAPLFSARRSLAAILILVGVIGWQQFERVRDSDEGRTAELEEQLADRQQRLHAAAQSLAKARDELRAVTQELASLKQKYADTQASLVQEQSRLQELEGRFRAVARRTTHSFVRSWQLLGPFAYREDGSELALEEPFRRAASYEGVGGMVRWRPYESEDERVDFAEFFKTKDRVVCYAVGWVRSDIERDVMLSIGSDDGMELWLNRKSIYRFDNQRSATAGQDAVPAHLNAGWNEIGVRVDNRGSADWALYLETRTADNSAPLKLFSTQVPPASFVEELNAAEADSGARSIGD